MPNARKNQTHSADRWCRGLGGRVRDVRCGQVLDPARWIGKFAAWGIPEWFVPVSGALELAGAIGLLIPVLRGLAGLGLALFMIGAVATHVVHAEIGMIFVAGAILAGSAAVGWFRLPETMALLRRGAAGGQ